MVDETNWAGNYRYRAERVLAPASIEELQDVVASSRRVRALGSRHSFTDIGDTDGTLLDLAGIPHDISIDATNRSVTVAAGARYGDLAPALEREGWALHNLASLPHISIAGAVATATHGSGTTSLAEVVNAVELVGPDGQITRIARGEDDFGGCVVSLGALGVVARLSLDIEPTYHVRQDVFTGLPWAAVERDFDAVMASADSVSLFTDLTSDHILQAWLKSRGTRPVELPGAEPAGAPMHMLVGGDTDAVTEQGGVSGPWLGRLPHFRMEFTPSRGEELQSEYLLPRRTALEGLARLRDLGRSLAPVLQGAEIRTVAPDTQWLSSSYEQETVGVHFTWLREPEGVYAVLPAIEGALLPLGARPHWGKCFVAGAEQLEPLYPRFRDFSALRDRLDPDRTFGNDFLDRVLG